jgi:thymidylate kinase
LVFSHSLGVTGYVALIMAESIGCVRAVTFGDPAAIVWLDVSPTVGLARVTARMADPTRASDADPTLHDQLRARFVPPTEAEGMRVMRVDGEGTVMRVAAEGMARVI